MSIIALSVLLGQGVVTTQVDGGRPAFAAASVKAIDRPSLDYLGRQLTSTTFTDRTDLLGFIISAYLDADGAGACWLAIATGGDCALIVGSVPAWARTDKFEIAAELPTESLSIETLTRLREFRFKNSARRNVYPAPVQLMLQRLLEETFDLKVRRERREIPVWAITLSKTELMLTPTTAGPAAVWHGFARSRGGTVPTRPTDRVQLMFEASTVKDAADYFSAFLDRPVVDLTALDGEYEFTLEFTPEPNSVPQRRGILNMAGFTAPRLSAGLERLGLKLEPAMASIDVLVIENVRRPSSN